MVKEYDVLASLNAAKNVKETILKIVKEEWFVGFFKRVRQYSLDEAYPHLTVLQLDPRFKGNLKETIEKMDFEAMVEMFEAEKSVFMQHCYAEVFTFSIINLNLDLQLKLELLDVTLKFLATPNKIDKEKEFEVS